MTIDETKIDMLVKLISMAISCDLSSGIVLGRYNAGDCVLISVLMCGCENIEAFHPALLETLVST